MKHLYKTKSVALEAVRFDGNNHAEIYEFCPRVQRYAIDDEGAAYELKNPRFFETAGAQMIQKGMYLVKYAPEAFVLFDEALFKRLFKEV